MKSSKQVSPEKQKLNKAKLLDALLEDFQEQSDDIQDQVIKELSESAITKGVGSFFCNNLNCMITVPCNVSECHYYVDTGKAAHNCILKAKFDRGNESMSIDVISEITDIPESRIRASLEKSFNKVRAHTLISDINADTFVICSMVDLLKT